MESVKSVKWSGLLINIGYIVLGILLFMYPTASSDTVADAFAFAAIAAGIVSIFRFFFSSVEESFYRNDFLSGLLFIALGAITLGFKYLIVSLIYIVVSLMIMLSGFSKLQDCMLSLKMKMFNSFYLVLSLVSIFLGILIIIDPFNGIETLNRWIGGSLTYCGLSDLIINLSLSFKLVDYLNDKEIPDSFVEEQALKEIAEEEKENTVMINEEGETVLKD